MIFADPVAANGKGKLRRSSSVATVGSGAGGSKLNRKESRGLEDVSFGESDYTSSASGTD